MEHVSSIISLKRQLVKLTGTSVSFLDNRGTFRRPVFHGEIFHERKRETQINK